jgi:hypothetical protein
LRYKRDAFKHPKSVNGCFFNFEQDILNFHAWANGGGMVATHGQRTRWLSQRTVEADIRNVKHMALAHISLMRELDTTRRYRPLPLPTFLHFSSLQKVVIVFTFHHTWFCAHCRNGEMPLGDHMLVDDAKMAVGMLKQDLIEGKTYSFMFGNEWMPPKWEWRLRCEISDWKRPYLASLTASTRVAEARAGDTMVSETVAAPGTSSGEAATPMDSTTGDDSDSTSASESTIIVATGPQLTEGESVAEASAHDTTSLIDTPKGERTTSTSTSLLANTDITDTSEDESASETETSSSEAASMMDLTDNQSSSSRTSSKLMMENSRDGD